jgi:hypothetical protein
MEVGTPVTARSAGPSIECGHRSVRKAIHPKARSDGESVARRERPGKTAGEKGIMEELPEYVDGLPNLCSSEQLVEAAVAASRAQPVVGGRSSVDIVGSDSAFAIALHMFERTEPG